MTNAREFNFDGLVGPTHNYGGLSFGNVASMTHGDKPSAPKDAALQGIAKMRTLIKLGIPQAVLPPQDRPLAPSLRAFGLTGTDAEVVARAAREAPGLLRNCASASAMWTANAATISPSADTADGRLHITPASLSAMFHRSIEHEQTGRTLQTIFSSRRFAHHRAIPGGGAMGDEGAANHTRLCAEYGTPGLEIFTYGRSAFERLGGTRFLPRQAKEASEAIARKHRLSGDGTIFVRQSQVAVDAGAFHNDVVGVGNGHVLFYHKAAYEEVESFKDEVRRKAGALGFEPIFIEVNADDVSLEDAIASYLFNSQLVTLPKGGMALILPTEAKENPQTRAYVEKQTSGNGPIREAHFLDVKQSMRNGGGPACLRLRVVLTEEEASEVAPGVIMDEEKLSVLENWVNAHYRDRLMPEDVADPRLLREARGALDELTQILGLGSVYDFQR